MATIKVFILFSRACDLDKDSSREILEYMAQQHGTAAYEILTENEEEFSKVNYFSEYKLPILSRC